MGMNIEPTPASSAAAPLPEPDLAATRKEERLFGSLRSLDSLLIAFSGGADSAYLAWAAHSAIGDRALSVTALSASFSRHDREQAEKFVRETGIRHEFIETHEFENALYVANNADRCYHCKDELFDRMESTQSLMVSMPTTLTTFAPDIARPTNIAYSLLCSTLRLRNLKSECSRNAPDLPPGIALHRLVFLPACLMGPR
jgi:hypothetical protein